MQDPPNPSADWDVIDETYKTVSAHPIGASIFLPKRLVPGSHPVILFLHGGYLIGGHRQLGPTLTPWILAHALTHHAIVVSADYRLLPTPNGAADINEDLEDFWAWTQTSLPRVLAAQQPGHRADLDRLLVFGASAGGYCATQLGLSHPTRVRALVAIYPMLDLDSVFWKRGYMDSDKTLGGLPKDSFLTPDEARRELAEMRELGVVSQAGPERSKVMMAAVQWGIWQELFDPRGQAKEEWLPKQRLVGGAHLPGRTWILHGSKDSGVPVQESEAFVDLVTRSSKGQIRLDVEQGEEHGFDISKPGTYTVDHPVIKAGLSYVTEEWLR